MGNGMMIGVDSKARKVKKVSIGIDGKARKVKKVFIGDANGKAKLVWQDFAMPTYTGTYVIYGNETKGRIELKTSGMLTLSEGIYDVFCVGGGGAGGGTYKSAEGKIPCGGGGGGYTKIYKALTVGAGSFTATIGSGGLGNKSQGTGVAPPTSGSQSLLTFSGISCVAVGGKSATSGRYTDGGDGGSGGGAGAQNATSNIVGGSGGTNGGNGGGSNGGTTGGDAGVGQGTTTRAFGESVNTLYSGGGGSGKGAGGAGGGGAGSIDYNVSATKGTANTGGGGGGAYLYGSSYSSGDGGSGLVIVRWGY